MIVNFRRLRDDPLDRQHEHRFEPLLHTCAVYVITMPRHLFGDLQSLRISGRIGLFEFQQLMLKAPADGELGGGAKLCRQLEARAL